MEVARHDVLGKYMRLVNTKGFAMWLPRNDVFVPVSGGIVKQFVELERKRELGIIEEQWNKEDCLESWLELNGCTTCATGVYLVNKNYLPRTYLHIV